jgi:hypothetical protein
MLKLFSPVPGLEIIGTIVEETDSYFDIDQPLRISAQATGADTYGLSFVELSLSNPDGVHRFYLHAIFSASLTIPPALEKAYIEATSKIQIVSRI